MTAPRVLLVEHLDAIGATPSDARLRAGALRAAGASVEVVVLDSDRGEDLQYGGITHRRDPGMTVWNAERAAAPLARLVREKRFDLALWASARPDDALAGQLPAALPAYHWSTGFASHGVRARALPPLDLDLEPCAGSSFDLGRMQRGRLSLWDGPFALVPTPLEADSALPVLEAFAATVSDRDEVDLVVLDHLRPALVRTARELGIELRVHFVGPAPREAEVAWLQTATVALVGGERPVSAGLVLRALASGCPMLPVGEEAGPLAGWLLARGLAPFAGSDAESLGDALECVLDGGARVAESRAYSRSVAERYTMEALRDRFAQALARLDARHDERAA